MRKLSKNRYVHHSTKCCISCRLEASVIGGDMCLGHSAFNARMNSWTCRHRILMAATPGTAIPPGLSDGDITCHQNSGQGLCQAHVIGTCQAQVYSHISVPSQYLIA